MLNYVKVSTLQGTTFGRLYLTYFDALRGDFDFERNTDLHFPYGVNMRGSGIILDLDKDYVLASIEVGIIRKYWTVTDGIVWPKPLRRCDLRISKQSVDHGSFDDLPMTLRTNQAKNIVNAIFGSGASGGEWLELGPQCLAKVEQDALKELFFDLRPAN